LKFISPARFPPKVLEIGYSQSQSLIIEDIIPGFFRVPLMVNINKQQKLAPSRYTNEI
jgi:hypothetical protein